MYLKRKPGFFEDVGKRMITVVFTEITQVFIIMHFIGIAENEYPEWISDFFQQLYSVSRYIQYHSIPCTHNFFVGDIRFKMFFKKDAENPSASKYLLFYNFSITWFIPIAYNVKIDPERNIRNISLNSLVIDY